MGNSMLQDSHSYILYLSNEKKIMKDLDEAVGFCRAELMEIKACKFN